MKIITANTIDKVKFFKEQEEIAEKDCYTCPCCRQKYLKNSIDIMDIKIIRKYFPERNYHITVFRCDKCCSIWESEPYLYNCLENRKLYENGKIFKYALKE